MTDHSKTPASRTSPHEVKTFGKAYTDIVRDVTLPRNVKTVYVYFTTWRNASKGICPSRARIAEETGLSVRSVDDAVAVGAAAGLWRVSVRTVDGARNKTNLYELLDERADGYVPGSGPIPAKKRTPREGATVAPSRDRVQPLRPVGATAAQETEKQERDKKDSPASRHHPAGRRTENYEQALKHHRHRVTAQGRAARRRWEMDGVSSSWLTRANPYLGADIENYIDHKWGCESNVRNMITDMVHRIQADGELVPPQKILNAALKESRWIEDEPPTQFADVGLGDFTPVLAMPPEDQQYFTPDDHGDYEDDVWDTVPVTAPAAPVEDPWDLGPGNPF